MTVNRLSVRGQIGGSRRRRYGVRAIFAAMVVATLASCGSDDAGGGNGTGPGFAVLASDDGVFLTDGKQVDRLDEFDQKDGVHSGASLAWYDDHTAVVLTGGRVGLVTAGGVNRSVECDGCSGLLVDQGQVLTVRNNYRPGDGFDIIALDAGLNEVAGVAAARVIERAAREQLVENSGPPRLVAATPDAIYVTYASRHGGARQGPSVLAKYARDGRRLDHMIIDGLVFDVVASPDRRYVALAAGGSSGACHTTADVRVVDLVALQQLQTEPDVPGESRGGSSTWFLTQDLSWGDDGLLTAIGERHDLGPDQDCDESPQLWARTYDPTTQEFVDDELDAVHDLRVIGPSCDEQIGYSRGSGRAVVSTADGAPTTLLDNAEILGATSAGLVC